MAILNRVHVRVSDIAGMLRVSFAVPALAVVERIICSWPAVIAVSVLSQPSICVMPVRSLVLMSCVAIMSPAPSPSAISNLLEAEPSRLSSSLLVAVTSESTDSLQTASQLSMSSRSSAALYQISSIPTKSVGTSYSRISLLECSERSVLGGDAFRGIMRMARLIKSCNL